MIVNANLSLAKKFKVNKMFNEICNLIIKKEIEWVKYLLCFHIGYLLGMLTIAGLTFIAFYTGKIHY